MITIYAKNNCKWCALAKELVESRNLPYQYLNTEEDVNHILSLMELKPDTKTLPQIWWDDRYIGGYTDFATEIENTIGDYGNGKI
jgi:glutaredoxin